MTCLKLADRILKSICTYVVDCYYISNEKLSFLRTSGAVVKTYLRKPSCLVYLTIFLELLAD